MPPKLMGPSMSKKGPEDGPRRGNPKKLRLLVDDSIYQSEDTSKYNAFCLPLLGGTLFCFALALIIIGAVRNIEDLIIVGVIFMLGSAIFFALLYYTVCRPMCSRNQVEAYEFFDRTDIRNVDDTKIPPPPDYSYTNDNFSDDDLLSARNKPGPSQNQLYGDKMRSFLATPATVSGVNFNGMETPPPPRLSMPSTPGQKTRPVFTAEQDDDMKEKRDISDLEML